MRYAMSAVMQLVQYDDSGVIHRQMPRSTQSQRAFRHNWFRHNWFGHNGIKGGPNLSPSRPGKLDIYSYTAYSRIYKASGNDGHLNFLKLSHGRMF